MTQAATNCRMPLCRAASQCWRSSALTLAGVLVSMMFALDKPALGATKWNCALPQLIDSSYGDYITEYASHVARATNGQVTIDRSSCITLSLSSDHLKPRKGTLELLSGTGFSVFSEQEPALGMESLPFLASNYDQLKWFHGFWRPEVDKLMSHRFGRKVLFMLPGQPQYLFTTMKVKRPDDFKKITIGTYSKRTTRLFAELGASTIELPLNKLMQVLRMGKIDAVTVPSAKSLTYDNIGSFSFMYPTNHSWSPSAVTVDLSAWRSLSREQQRAIEELTNELEPRFWARTERYAADESSKLASQGVKAASINEDLLQFFKRQTKPLREKEVTRMREAAARILDGFQDYRVPRKCPPHCKKYPPNFCRQYPKLCYKR